MKSLMIVILVFLCPAAHAQRSLLIGDYDNGSGNDTSKYIYLSRDSVKEVNTTRIKKGKDMWLQIKCGTWVITKYDPNNGYLVTFSFNDGTAKDVVFHLSYNSRPLNDSTPPDGYSLEIDYQRYTNVHGKNGLISKIMPQIMGMKAGQ